MMENDIEKTLDEQVCLDGFKKTITPKGIKFCASIVIVDDSWITEYALIKINREERYASISRKKKESSDNQEKKSEKSPSCITQF